METPIDHPLTLTVEQTAKLLGIGRSTAYELVHTGDIPSLRLGRRIVVPVAKLAEVLGLGQLDLAESGTMAVDHIEPAQPTTPQPEQGRKRRDPQPSLF